MTTRAPAAEFVLLTGALGSGKTTLLSHYLATPLASETGVIVNDAGEINVDGAVIANGARGLPVAQLGNGCVCCSAGAGLGEAIDELLRERARAGRGPLRQIVLETSGLAEPGPILRALRGVTTHPFQVRTLATFDCAGRAFEESGLPQYLAQLAAAQSVVLTKTDRCGGETRERRRDEARRHAPLARILDVEDPAQRSLAALAPDGTASQAITPHTPSIPDRGFACHPRLSVFRADWAPAPDWADIEDWLENIAAFCGERLLRAKGVVRPRGALAPVLLHAVGDCFSPPQKLPQDWRGPEGLVLIARDLDLAELAAFNAELGEPAPVLTETATA